MKSTLIIIVTSLLANPLAFADETEYVIKYRKAVMKAIGGHTSAAGQLVRGKVSMDGDLQKHATALAALNTDLPRLFPEGSDFGETSAKENIWDEWAEFKKASTETANATRSLAEAVESGDSAAIGAAYKAVGKSCKGCHKKYRQKDDE